MVAVFKKWLLATLYGSGSRTDFWGIDLPSVGAIWFLLALFISLALMNFIHAKKCGGVIVIISLLSVLTAKITWFPFSIQAGGLATLFVYIGWLGKKREAQLLLGSWWQWLVLLGIWTIAIVCSYINLNMSLVKCQVPNGLIDIAGSIAATIIIVNVSSVIEKHTKLIGQGLAFIGQNSLVIMCAHLIELNTFPWNMVYAITGRNLIILSLVYILKVCWAIMCVYMIKLYKNLCRGHRFPDCKKLLS